MNLGATARWIVAHAPDRPVTLVTTGSTSEDGAVAAQLAGRARGRRRSTRPPCGGPSATPPTSTGTGGAGRGDRRELAAFRADVDLCADVDRHPLALVVRRDADVAPHPVLVAERA